MEDYCDRIPGQHTGRLSLEHQAREAAEWQRKVDDLQKQLDSANRIIQIKDETISLLEKRCNNLREELDELSDRVAVLHERIIEQNNAIRNSVKTSPAAGASSPISPEVPQAHGLTPPATPSASDDCVETIQTSTGQEWIVRLSKDLLTISDEYGEILHRSRGHVRTGVYLAMLIEKDRNLQATPSAAVGAEQPELPKFPAGVEFCSAMEGQAKAWESIWEWCCKNGLNIDSFPSLNGPQLIASWILELKKSAAVGASEPVAGDHKEWCDGAKEFCERQNEPDTVPRAEYDRVVKLNHHLREAAVMSITERVPSDSKPTNVHNPESKDTPPHNPVMGPVVGTANVKHQASCPAATAPTVPPEVGKRYVCRNGEVTKPMRGKGSTCYPYTTEVGPKDVLRTWTENGKHDLYREGPLPYDLIAEYHEPEPSPPAELHPVDRLRRELDDAVEHHADYTSKIDKALGQPRHGGDLLTEHLREIERLKALSATTYPPAESPDDWVMITDPKHDARQCDECRCKKIQYDWAPCCGLIGCRIGDSPDWEFRCRRKDLPPVPVVPPALPSPWRPMTEKPTGGRFWLAWDDGKVILSSDIQHWPCPPYPIAWTPIEHPLHPNEAPPDKPKTRTVTLREYRVESQHSTIDPSFEWTTLPRSVRLDYTGRTCKSEVPE